MSLSAERCEACTGSTPRVEGEEAERLRTELDPAWEIVEGRRLRRALRFRDFTGAFATATRVALLAQEEGHHPDLCVGWGSLEIVLVTHAVGALTRSDFVLAAKIDAELRR